MQYQSQSLSFVEVSTLAQVGIDSISKTRQVLAMLTRYQLYQKIPSLLHLKAEVQLNRQPCKSLTYYTYQYILLQDLNTNLGVVSLFFHYFYNSYQYQDMLSI